MSNTSTLPEISTMSLEQKLGQMLLLGFRGTHLTDENPILSDIRDRYIGGVVLFDYDLMLKSYERNIASPGQVAKLTGELASQADIPLFIAIDQEGGIVNRLKPAYGFAPTRSHKELGEKNDTAETLRHSREIAEEVRKSGHNLNFAPCLDLAINKENKAIYGRERCFSEDPEVAALHASAYIRGHHETGVLTAVKHFPGHGSSREDTHLGMADVTETWQEYEVLPYQRLLDEGLCDMIMTTHIFNRRLDPDFPATLSRNILTGMLRQRLGWNGVIVSDDLQMKAITAHFGTEAAMKQALMAGVDLLIYGNNLDFDPVLAETFFKVAREMMEQGEMDEQRIDESVARIFDLKKRW